MSIAVIDYGLGNLRSVAKALETAGADVVVTNDPQKISAAKAIVFPGVGAFGRGMQNLEKLKILPVLVKSIKDGVPFLGLCLGLQLLFTQSEEHGVHKGLDIIKGNVKKFSGKLKVPHMGWNNVSVNRKAQGEELTKLLSVIKEKRTQLQEALKSPAVTRASVEPLVKEIKSSQAKLIDYRINGIFAVREVLTPEQLAKFQDIAQKRQEIRKKHLFENLGIILEPIEMNILSLYVQI